MFSSDHAIFKAAHYHDELDDWLPYAEELIREWSNLRSGEVASNLNFPFHIYLAALLLQDDLLPASARMAFARLMLETINEATDNKISIKCLGIKKPKPGRKKEGNVFFWFREVRAFTQAGKTKTEAYKVVGEKYHKAPETIRRECERAIKPKKAKLKRDGENDKQFPR